MTPSDNGQQLREPKLEDYGLDTLAYSDYIQKIARLKGNKDSLDQEISRREPSWIWIINSLLVVAVFVLMFWLVGSLVHISKWFAGLLILQFIVLGFLLDEERNIVANVLSLGKLNKAKSAKGKIEKRIKIVEQQAITKFAPFEDATKNFYEVRIEDSYKTKLFRKRSGTEQRQQSRRRYASLLA